MGDPYSSEVLEGAITALHKATDSRGLKIFLLADPLNKKNVGAKIADLASAFEIDSVFLDGAPGELAACKNLRLLIDLYVAHLNFESGVT